MENKKGPEFSAEELVRATGGSIIFGERTGCCRGISTDSRKTERENLFVALQGKNFNGHDFIKRALIKGAAGIITSSRDSLKHAQHILKGKRQKPFFIQVPDTLTAYQEIARSYRKKFHPTVIGVTGSNGKSTTKEMIASVAESRYSTLKNKGNFNNHIGLPMTLFNLHGEIEVAVLEMGMSNIGEIKRLCEISVPSIGVVTNVGIAHLGSIDKVREAKGELISYLGEKGTAILNNDDPNVSSYRERCAGRVITFGIKNEADIRAGIISREGRGHKIRLRYEGDKREMTLPAPGFHNIYNALAAAAAGIALNIGLDEISEALESYSPLPMRMEYIRVGNVLIINDAYNANPSSMQAAIKTLSAMSEKGKKILVAGDMLELGDKSDEAHREMARMAVQEGIDYLFSLGDKSHIAAKEAMSSGMARDRVYRCEDLMETVLILDEELEDGDCVMIKGSRGMKMERIVEELIQMRKAS